MFLQAREVGQAHQNESEVSLTCAISVHVTGLLKVSHTNRPLLKEAQTIGNGEVDSSVVVVLRPMGRRHERDLRYMVEREGTVTCTYRGAGPHQSYWDSHRT